MGRRVCMMAVVLAPLLVTLTPDLSVAEEIAEIGPAEELRQLHTGLGFTEGPAADGEDTLYFSDIPAATIHRLGDDGELEVFTSESRHANGLMVRNGQMLACEMDGQIAAWDLETGTRRVIASEYNGQRFNAPNDLVIDSSGGAYFTDPHFRAPQPLPQGTMGVYYVDGQGTVSRVAEDLPAPNGVLLSPDEKTLYVLPTGDSNMLAYPVLEPGQLGESREFCRLESGGADGATMDTDGNLYITSENGIQVFDNGGNSLGIIEVPEQPANLTFGGPDRKTLYITARTSLYAVPMHAQGHRFGE